MKLPAKRRPRIREISEIHLPPVHRLRLDNDIEVFDIRQGTEDVLKVEIVFHAGRPYEHKRLVSRVTAQMLKEGTANYTGTEIAEIFDFHGATLNIPVNLDYSTITIYTLKRHFDKLLPLLREMLSQPTLPSEDFQSFIKRSKQRLSLDLSKNDVTAYRILTEKLFGAAHFYGYNSSPALYDALTIGDLQHHFDTLYRSNNCQIFISGKTDDGVIRQLNETLGEVLQPGKIPLPTPSPIPDKTEKIYLERPESLQSSIRLGRQLFNKNHDDYCGMFVLNTILGGYFGSRLMTNIREEKGYTYNIYSSLDAMRYDGYFYIASEVGKDFVRPALNEIYAEIERLKTKRITRTELRMVRRYLLGNMLTMLDGPFHVSELTRTIFAEDAPENHFDTLVETIRNITPETLQSLAQKYLSTEDMWEVIVG